MKVVSWNVNSIRARYDRVLTWVQENEPDVICLQELKCTDDAFPYDAFSYLGYACEVFGQKTYNGVAILSFEDPTDVVRNMGDGVDDPQSRLIAATVEGVRVIDVYVPNGGKVGSDKWRYKMAWYDRFGRWLDANIAPDQPTVICGDFNVAPLDLDCAHPDKWAQTAMCHPDGRAALARITERGWVDTFRLHHADGGHYSWWDYRGAGFRGDDGLRIDHVYVNGPLVPKCSAVFIDRAERAGEKASDHAPIGAVFDI